MPPRPPPSAQWNPGHQNGVSSSRDHPSHPSLRKHVSASQHLAVTCLTCGSRLRVMDRQLIGSISNCPKCGAMVEIKPDPIQPAASNLADPPSPLPSRDNAHHLAVGDSAGVDSEALTQSSIADPDDLATPPVATGAAFQPGNSALDANLDAPAADLPVDPSAVWQSESSRRTSQMALVVMLAIFGLIAATVGFIQFARSFTTNEPIAQNRTDDQTQSTVDQPKTELDASQASESQSDQPQPEAAAASSPEPDANTAEPMPVPSDTNSQSVPPKPDPNAITPVVTPAVEPIAVVPEKTEPPAVGPAITAPPITDDASGAMDDLPAGLRKFVPLLDVSTADNGAPQVFPTPPTIDSVRLDAAAELDTEETSTVKRASIDVPKLLTMRFAIDNRGATLSELVLLVSQLTGVPIELELISIDLAGVSVNQPLQTPAGWMPIGQWLQQSLDSAGLAMEVGDGAVLVHASAQRLLDAGGQTLVLDDFGDDAEKIASWLKPIVTPIVGPADDAEVADPIDEEENAPPVDPAAKPPNNAAAEAAGDDKAEPVKPWSFDAAEKRLVVPADRYLLVQSICAAEAMRLMRGKPTKLPRQQTNRWIGRWASLKQPDNDPNAITDWPLVTDGPAGAQLDSPRTIAGLLRRVATENRAAVLVVWQDAMRHQVYPTDLAMPLSDGLTVGAYLDELVGESGLQARNAGDSVWWIGSEGLYDRYEVITWMTIPAGSGDVIARRLALTLGVADPAELPITWDDSTLMIRAPRYIARQLQRFIAP